MPGIYARHILLKELIKQHLGLFRQGLAHSFGLSTFIGGSGLGSVTIIYVGEPASIKSLRKVHGIPGPKRTANNIAGKVRWAPSPLGSEVTWPQPSSVPYIH